MEAGASSLVGRAPASRRIALISGRLRLARLLLKHAGMLSLFVVAAVALLLVTSYDVSRCVAFYRAANGAAPVAVDEEEPPRSIVPNRVSLRHALLFLIQKANYYWQMVTGAVLLAKLYVRPARATDHDVAMMMINTSLATWVTSKPIEGGVVIATLSIEGFAFPLFPDRRDNRLVVETELSPGDRARTLRFELNGEAIASTAEQLSILAMMTSSVTHPVIHSFNNKVYAHHADRRLEAFEDFFLHGQYLNWCCWFWPGLFFRIGPRGHHWYREVLAHNAQLPLPKHGRASMGALLPYSRTLRFLMAARPALARVWKRYELPVDLESLFLCTIMHAVDHVSCDIHTRGRLMKHDQLPDRGFFNWIALLFYRPAQHFWTNRLVDKRSKNPLYGELYAALHAIDPELADHVTLSISY